MRLRSRTSSVFLTWSLAFGSGLRHKRPGFPPGAEPPLKWQVVRDKLGGGSVAELCLQQAVLLISHHSSHPSNSLPGPTGRGGRGCHFPLHVDMPTSRDRQRPGGPQRPAQQSLGNCYHKQWKKQGRKHKKQTLTSDVQNYSRRAISLACPLVHF